MVQGRTYSFSTSNFPHMENRNKHKFKTIDTNWNCRCKIMSLDGHSASQSYRQEAIYWWFSVAIWHIKSRYSSNLTCLGFDIMCSVRLTLVFRLLQQTVLFKLDITVSVRPSSFHMIIRSSVWSWWSCSIAYSRFTSASPIMISQWLYRWKCN